MKYLYPIFGKWVKIGPLPLPVYALYVLIPSIIEIILIALDSQYTVKPFVIIGFVLAALGMLYQMLRK